MHELSVEKSRSIRCRVGDDVIGTISADRPYDENAPLGEEARILDIVASMVANDLRARREASIERQELEDENIRLRRQLGDRFRPENIIGTGSFKERINLFERDLLAVDGVRRAPEEVYRKVCPLRSAVHANEALPE